MERTYDLPRLFDIDDDTGEWVGLPDSDKPVEIGGLPKEEIIGKTKVPEWILKGLPEANRRRVLAGAENPPYSKLGKVYGEDR